MVKHLLLGALSLIATAVNGQKFASWTEPSSSVQFNIAIPEASAAPFDVYASIVAPINNTWAAIAFGGCMLRSPLLVAWKNDTNVLAAPRWAAEYHPPSLYNLSSVVTYKSSSVNSTHWKANVLCTGCSSWIGGSTKAIGSATFGWGISNRSIANPASLDTGIPFHNVGKGHFEVNITTGRNEASSWSMLRMGM